MTKVEHTTEYNQFSRHECNRKMDEKHVQRIMTAIEEKNLLDLDPIIVDSNYCVIDGQHRLEAARRLGISAPYIVNESVNSSDMKSLNSILKPWGLVDYLNHYARLGHSEYELLEAFMNENKMQISIALQLLNGSKNSNFFKIFKSGKYRFPSNAEYAEVMVKKIQISEVIEFIKRKTSGGKTYLDRVTFYGAMVDFFNIKSFNYDTFMKKLQYKIDLIHPCTRQCDYVSLFKDIYNFKNQSPIELESRE